MDILDFINSRDIRGHLRKIGYQLSPLEAAFVIRDSAGHTFEEKLAAFEWLIQNSKDFGPFERNYCFHFETFHDFLRRYIAFRRVCLQRFLDGDGAVYSYSWSERNDWIEDHRAFSTFADCLAAIRRDNEDGEAQGFLVRKTRLETAEHYDKNNIQDARLNSGYEITSLESVPRDEEERMLAEALNWVWISLPTPFKRGDILQCMRAWVPYEEHPFVLDALTIWDRKDYMLNGFAEGSEETVRADQTVRRLRENGDSSDMGGYCYYLTRDFGLIRDHTPTFNFLDLEYFRGELTGVHKGLRGVSQFLKGTVGMEVLVNGCVHALLEADLSEKELAYRNNYTKEGQAILGLTNGDCE